MNQRRPFFFIYMDFCTGQLPTRKLGSSEQAGTIKRKSVHPRQKSQSLTFSSQSGIHHFRSILFVSGKLLDLDDTPEEWIIERHDMDPQRPLLFPATRPKFRQIASWLPLLTVFASENSFCGSLRSAGFPCGSACKESACNAWDQSPSWEDPLEKGKATHSCILAWKILWTIQLPRVGQDWVTFTWDQHLLSRILPVSTPRRVFFRHPGALLWKLNHQGRQDPQLPVSARGQESNSYQPANIDDLTTTSNLPQHPPTVFN